MARKNKEVETKEKKIERVLKRSLEEIKGRIHLLPDANRFFEIGQEVKVGNLEGCVVFEVLEEGKIIGVDYTRVDNNYGNPIRNEHQKSYYKWMEVIPICNNKESFIQNEDVRLNYSQTGMRNLLSKHYFFGVDYDADYQREYVWTREDQESLLDSIFNHADIGKFAYILIDNKTRTENGYKYSYEMLDGKQKALTIIMFYEDRITYKGKKFSELSWKDRNHFENYLINVAETENLTEEQKLRYFLTLNTAGKPMDQSHMDMIRKRLEEMESGK